MMGKYIREDISKESQFGNNLYINTVDESDELFRDSRNEREKLYYDNSLYNDEKELELHKEQTKQPALRVKLKHMDPIEVAERKSKHKRYTSQTSGQSMQS
eukprot:CAMPEP_0170539398 /NCGR_PEP_ID=MMETSP0209-20121228/103906_1 /TAXON_ID=665100 ORGANISM="Litonotus pictus, Strain P1" /NCGR_SAMPLE_ID=MMETSP0209 /ASSEMBLY_ACC=CAM_ASM_000301 /LENGTH=100 /DNA_ID=CAMNT_0010841317 /DNA_START=614 /DNA_END=913 /DNA_ORIENTATION=-